MNHLFTLHSSKGEKLFLPIDSVLKVDSSPPAASNVSSHPYIPEPTAGFVLLDSEKEDQSETQFVSQQLGHHENFQIKKRQEDIAKRHENQNRPLGNDFDVHKIDVDEQKRLYEEVQRASKQGSRRAKKKIKTNIGVINGSQKHGGTHNQLLTTQQSSGVDAARYGHNVGQQQFHGPQVLQQQNQQPGYFQDHGIDPTGYEYNPGQLQLYNPQVPQGQQPGYYDQDVVHHQNQSNSQSPYFQSDPAAQMAHIPRGGVGDDHPHYTGMPYNYKDDKGLHDPRHEVQFLYESMPDSYSQQQQQQSPSSYQINPYNLEEGSMILHGDPPRSGIIKWIGYLPEAGNVLIAGLELVSIAIFCLKY